MATDVAAEIAALVTVAPRGGSRAGQRVGIFGGAFDPPHLTHLALAQGALHQLKLDELRVMPTGHAWHKSRTLSPAAHRVAMTRLAFEREARVVVDERETLRDGPTYTIDTLRELKTSQPEAEFFLLMGGDQARALTSWREWTSIFQYATICIAERQESLSPTLTSSSYPWLGGAYQGKFNDKFVSVDLPPSAINATDIRQQVAQGRDVTPLVGPGVARYIAHHHLYSSD